jgi:hypothetical protein
MLRFDTFQDLFFPYEIYSTEDEAKKLSSWFEVKGIRKRDWKTAIGDRKDDESLEEAELSRCCANISEARDLLLLCQKNSGLIQRDVNQLHYLLKGHEAPLHKPVLDKILAKLKLPKW